MKQCCHPERSEGSRPRVLKADTLSLLPHGTRSFAVAQDDTWPFLSVFQNAQQAIDVNPFSESRDWMLFQATELAIVET